MRSIRFTFLLLHIFYLPSSRACRPPYQSWSPSFSPPSFLGIAVLGALHYLIRLVEQTGSKAKGELRHSFSDAFREWIEPYDSISELSVAAFSSTYYFQFIEENEKKKIKRVKLLLLADANPPMCSNTPYDQEKIVSKWKALVSKGQVGKLEIRRTKRQLFLYFSIAERHRALVGLLYPDPNLENLKAKEAIIFSRESAPEAIEYLRNWFKSMWENADEILFV